MPSEIRQFCVVRSCGHSGRGRLKNKSFFSISGIVPNGVSFTDIEKICREIGFHGKMQEFSFVYIKFQMFEKHPHGVVK